MRYGALLESARIYDVSVFLYCPSVEHYGLLGILTCVRSLCYIISLAPAPPYPDGLRLTDLGDAQPYYRAFNLFGSLSIAIDKKSWVQAL